MKNNWKEELEATCKGDWSFGAGWAIRCSRGPRNVILHNPNPLDKLYAANKFQFHCVEAISYFLMGMRRSVVVTEPAMEAGVKQSIQEAKDEVFHTLINARIGSIAWCTTPRETMTKIHDWARFEQLEYEVWTRDLELAKHAACIADVQTRILQTARTAFESGMVSWPMYKFWDHVEACSPDEFCDRWQEGYT